MPTARRMNRRSSAGPNAIITTPEPQTVEDVEQMDEESILAFWPQVTTIMEGNVHRSTDDESTRPTPKSTGQAMNSHTAGSEFAPLDWATVKAMSPREYMARKSEIDSFIARGGRA